MKRFIILSFIFLGLGFYELSGGADFDPETAAAEAVEARVARATERAETLAAAVSAPVAPSTVVAQTDNIAPAPSDTVTRAQLDLVSFEAVTNPAPVPDTSEAGTEAGIPGAQAAATPDIAELATVATAQGTPLSMAALESAAVQPSDNSFSGSTQIAASTPLTGFADIRRVKGDRVNLRSGPGTDYDVIDQLAQATEVEVLTNNGNGWVELRLVNGNQTGWIAEFLLTGG